MVQRSPTDPVNKNGAVRDRVNSEQETALDRYIARSQGPLSEDSARVLALRAAMLAGRQSGSH